MAADRIAVIGAGVIGLSIAHELSSAGRPVTVLHELEPLATTSAVSGAVWFPYAAEKSAAIDVQLEATFARFVAIAGEHPDAGIDMRDGTILERHANPDRSWTRFVPGAREAVDLPAGASGMDVTVPLATMSQYLPWLEARCRGMGVQFVQRRVDDVDALASDFETVVVAAGVHGGELLGDDSVVPIRGQVVRVANPGLTRFLVDDEHEGGLAYILPRRDCVVLGGTHEPGALNLEPDPEIEAGILERTAELIPALRGQQILSRAAGLRPARERLRLEEVGGYDLRVIAAYGHGGSGMTLSWGTAERVAALVAG